MNTIEIKNILNCDKITKNSFLGVFPIDQLPPRIVHFPSALIVNLDPKHLPGSHWVCLYFDKNYTCEYFDSYGLRPNLLLESYILKNAHSFVYNNRQIQGFFSKTCGPICIYFLIWRCRNINFKDIVQSLNSPRAEEFVAGFVYVYKYICEQTKQKNG